MEKKKEPGLQEVHKLISEFFNFTKNQFEKNERITRLMGEQLIRTDKEIKDIKTTVKHVEQDVLTIKEDVDAIASTVSDNSLKVVNHERRVTRLERTH